MSRHGAVAGQAPALLRLAHQMVGDPGVALDIVGRTVSRRRVRRAIDAANDQVVVTALVREALRAPAAHVPDDSPLSDLSRRERVAVVLAFAANWDADGIAEAMPTTSRRVRAIVRRALEITSELQWRSLLASPGWDVPVGSEVGRRATAAAHRRRAHRVVSAIAAATAATLVTGVATVTVRIVTAPGPLPPTAKAHGLLPWTPRGSLVRDPRFVAAATSLWHWSPQRPRGDVFVLYAGRVGAGRLAVLQAVGGDGRARVAVVADHDVTLHRPRLRLDVVAPLPRHDVPVLTVPYDGNLAIPGLTTGLGSRVLQALVAPGVDQVDVRSLGVGADPTLRPGFTHVALDAGLSRPWLDLSGALPDTLVRTSRHGRVIFTGLVAATAIQPRPTVAGMVPPPLTWARLPVDQYVASMTDDILWWQQVCHSPETSVALAWAGRVRAVTTPVRLELVQCPGQPLSARWLDGGAEGAHWVGEVGRLSDALVAVIPPESLGPSTLVVVGSTAVRTIEISGVTTQGRVARALIKGTEPGTVVARGRDRRRLSVAVARLLASRTDLVL